MAINSVQLQLHLVTVEEYERMVQISVFPKDERLEMIEGRIFSLPAASASAASRVRRLDGRWANGTTTRVIVSVHDAIRLPRSEPQPDLALLKLRADNYFGGHPAASDVLLAVEVAGTAADYDRNAKIPLYGRNRIPEAWLIDLSEQTIEVYRQPNNNGYGEKRTYASGDQLAPPALPEISLPAASLLGISL